MQRYSLVELGSPPITYGEDGFTQVTAVNNKADATGWASAEAVLWDVGSLTKLPPTDKISWGSDINDADVIVGMHHLSYPSRAFVYANGQIIDLGLLLRGVDSTAIGVNNSGLVVGRAGSIGDNHPFLYQLGPGTTTYLEPVPGTEVGYACAVNELGDVAGISENRDGTNSRAFLYRDGDLIDVGAASWLTGLNDADVATGSKAFNDQYPWHAYRADLSSGPAVFVDLGHSPLPGFTGSHGNGINNAGIVVGHSFKTPEDGHWQAFVDYPTGHPDAGFHDLTPRVDGADGWELEQAVDINDNGVIVGNGKLNGQPRSFMLFPTKVRSGFEIESVLQFVQIFGGVTAGGSGTGILPGGKPIPIPLPVWLALSRPERDLELAAALAELARSLGDNRAAETVRAAGRQIREQAIEELHGR